MSPLHALLTLLALALLAATVPLVLELLVLSIAGLLPERPPPVSSRPLRLAVVIPAHDEEKLIASCVAGVLRSSSPAVEVWVVAHNCTDATAALASAAGARILILHESIGGKGAALHHGFTHALAAGAEALLVVDADSIVSSNLTALVASTLAAGPQAVQCRYTVASPATPRTRLAALGFLGFNVLRPRGRARLGLSCGLFGNGFALTASTLRRIPYHANSLVEDLEYHLHLLRAGIRVHFLDAAAVSSEMPESSSAAAGQRARWEGGRILLRRHWTVPLLRGILAGHLRLVDPLLDLLSLPLATEALLLLVALLLPVPWLRLYAVLGLLTLGLYVLGSASLAPHPAEILKSLASAPRYVFWKLANHSRTRRAAHADTAWVRTPRGPAGPSSRIDPMPDPQQPEPPEETRSMWSKRG